LLPRGRSWHPAGVSVSFKTRRGEASRMGVMRVGIGLPAAVPGTDMTLIGRWAREAERAGFEAVGVIDRLIYDNLDPLTALAAASASTGRVELMTTVCNVCWRNNAVLLAKQLSSLVRLSGDRLTAGLGMGGWPADYEASGVPMKGRGAHFDASLATLDRIWQATGDRPRVLMAGTVAASFARAATPLSDGWVAPLFGLELLRDGAAAVRAAWSGAGRPGSPRIATGRYVCLGPDADRIADEYIHHYYGADYFAFARADTFTDAESLREEIARLAESGCDDLILFPCSGDLDQVARMAEAVHERDRAVRATTA
jgi:alkanesulfonate monooxygenase SsuD/methylene tetrahydromethanopterin reductase-like flavin-dependent oxidoreductase (luciferase family)